MRRPLGAAARLGANFSLFSYTRLIEAEISSWNRGKGMNRLSAVSIALCMLSIAIVGLASSTHENNGKRTPGTFDVHLNLTLEEPSGILAFQISHPTDLRFRGNISRDVPPW